MTHSSRLFNPPAIRVWAWHQFKRDWRSGELSLLIFSIILAVAALSSVTFFVDRLDRGLSRDAAQLLGGDIVLLSDYPIPAIFEQKAQQLGLKTAHLTLFASMVRASDEQGGAVRLVAIKGVNQSYPLRGQILVKASRQAVDSNLPHGPAPGEIWVEETVLNSLHLQVGDSVWVGDKSLRIGQILRLEPDRTAAFMIFAPRVLVHEADLAATGLVQPTSRITYKLAIAATTQNDTTKQSQLNQYTTWAAQYLKTNQVPGMRMDTLETGRPETRQTIVRAEQFLKLVALLTALLSAIAVAIAARNFAARRLDSCAMLRVLGESQKRIAWGYALEFLGVGALASLIGVCLGLAMQKAFIVLAGNLIGTDLPAPSWWPAIFGLGVGWMLCLGFGFPPILQLANVPPLRVIRRDMGAPRKLTLVVMLGALAAFILLLWGVADDPKLGGWALAGFTAAAIAFAVSALLITILLRKWVQTDAAYHVPGWLRLAIRQLSSQPVLSLVQITSFGLGLFALILLMLLRTDLIHSWRQATPPDAPNQFVINILPEQAEPFQTYLKSHGIQKYDWYPMARGRLIAINGQAIQTKNYTGEQARQLIDREFNLSYSQHLPDHNPIVDGHWQGNQADAISIEQSMMSRLDLNLGDRLQFDVGGKKVEGRITSVRKVDWASMRVNFFVIFPHKAPPDVPISYIAAFHVDEGDAFSSALSQAFPNLTVIDVGATILQMQRILSQVIRAVELLFVFALLAGLAVLIAAFWTTRGARLYEFAVLRALGANNKLLARVQTAELCTLGFITGLLASLAALSVGWVLAVKVLSFEWSIPLWWLLLGGLFGAALAWLVGWFSLRRVLTQSVSQTLRET